MQLILKHSNYSFIGLKTIHLYEKW
jgi:hypothetical protein